MSKTNSKNIGNNYEREFSYILSEWITGEKGADICWRDVSSGSRYSKRKVDGKETARKADIVCTVLEYSWFFLRFYIDTKSYKEFNWCWINKKNRKSNAVLNQWKKTVNECPKDMIPMMPVKIRDHKTPEMIFLPKTVYIDPCIPYIFISMNDQYSCYLVLLSDFLAGEKAEKFYEKNKIFK